MYGGVAGEERRGEERRGEERRGDSPPYADYVRRDGCVIIAINISERSLPRLRPVK